MGQQQLLLLVLGVVIVGLAVVVGINAFSENQVRSNADAMVTEGLRFASDIQAYALKPDQFGGGGGWEDTKGSVSFEALGIDSTTVNGDYEINGDGCTSSEGVGILGTGANENGNEVCITITGTSADDVTTDVTYGS